MINYFFGTIEHGIVGFSGLIAAFLLTIIAMWKGTRMLPKDQGRQFAHDGSLSEGKPRGAGFLFIMIFVLVSAIFCGMTTELSIYLVLIVAAMMTGFLDDCAKTPWGEYKKGILDLIIAIMLAVTYLNFNTNKIYISIINEYLTIPKVVFGILVVILVWTSINVTNCADGVDGLSGTLTIITLSGFYVIHLTRGMDTEFGYMELVFIICILGYLWFNATPSKLLMGDAGSRAMGLFIAIAALKSGSPVLYIPVAFVLIVDGGIGLVKVFLLRFLKIHILKNTRTPLHDHVRKVWGWSNTHTVFRFAIIQIMLCIVAVYLVMF